MKLLKNREISVTLILTAAIGAAAAAACLFIDPRASVVCVLLTAAFAAVFLVGAHRRYSRMARLADSLDRMLSGAEGIDLSGYSEGELGILQSELMKLTAKLREQTSALRGEKILLADSIADISHQIKTPLTSMNLMLAALGEDDPEGARRAELLPEMHRQLSRIDWLVSALLKLAKLDADAVSMDIKELPLDDLVRDSLAPIAIQMELRGQEAEVSASGSILCDRSWTAEALTNIMKNCSEHMGEGTLHIAALENPLYSQITVRDEGEGIAAEDLPHIFERFYRGRNSSAGGVGIGLALARMIIVKQNGTVKAENAPEGGAKFTVRFYKGAV